MVPLFLGVLLVLGTTRSDTSDLEVTGSGMMKLKRSDMVVTFFVTLRHSGRQPLRAMLSVVECCEKITDEDIDCDIMDLYGGDLGVLQPGVVKNVTLVYPNLYGYNRRGSCLVNILHRCQGAPESSEVHHRIDFDTTTSTENVPTALQGWYKPETFINCETPDLDPFDHCNPVDCHTKYSGYRNYYNHKWKVCQRVPTCLADPDKELPDVAYVPNSNTCRNLDAAVTQKDIELLTKGGVDVDSKMVNIRCHHGEIDPRTGLCICDRGWKSENFDEDAYSSGSGIYSMCTIRCETGGDYKYLPPLVGLAVALWVFLCVVCCERHGAFRPAAPCPAAPARFPQAAVYFPVGDDLARHCSTVASVLASAKTSFDGLKPFDASRPHSPFSPSERTLVKNSRSLCSSKSALLSFSSGKDV